MTKGRRSRIRRAAAQAKAEPVVPPTPQTVSQLTDDVIGRLLRQGRLHLHHAMAAEEIRSVMEAVGRGMFPSAQLGWWAGRPVRRRLPSDFLDRMSDEERHMWERHYLPWTHELAVEIAAGLRGTRWLQLVLDVVIDNMGLRTVEDRYRIRHGRAFAYLVQALEKYARGAGLASRG